ncbi:MAG: ribosomal RNA small subunit methyltransferase A [Candidatus Heimdallarchaeota archaeon]|nr:MAG: ribosomal RNA small subunit methyltransferase A [Candidatus Heimdallarchaeota archaeon]
MSVFQLLEKGNLKKYTETLIQNYAISPKKSKGQNFVINKSVIDSLLIEANLDEKDTIVEVGSGIGTLTYFLLQNCQKVFSYEIDPILSTIISKEFFNFGERLEVISGDFLKLEIPPHQKLISNLPYGISSPFIKKISEIKNRPEIIVVTLQSEFANHLCAKPGDPDYSRISVFSSFFYEFEVIQTFPPYFFTPKPHVQSNLVRGNRLEPPKLIRSKDFFKFLTLLFCRKHKKVRNNLQVFAKGYPRDLQKLFRLEIDKLEYCAYQPINLSPNQILDLYQQLKEIMSTF